MPYDRFVKLQLAADLMPDAKRDDMRALGYVGAAPIYHHDLRLSGDVIGGFLTDDWDERIDAVSRGVLGISVACARCHDHKFDPITTKDYYALMGVFASTVRVERPMFPVDPKVEQQFMWLQRQLFDLAYSINLLSNEGSTFTNGAEKAVKWKAEMEGLQGAGHDADLAAYPQLVQSLDEVPGGRARRGGGAPPAAHQPPCRRLAGGGTGLRRAGPGAGCRSRATAAAARGARPWRSCGTEPYMNAVFEAAQYVDASDPSYTFITYKPGEARDMPVLKAGNYAAPGEIVPRGFPAVLAKGDTTFKQGSGRLELADRIFTDAPGLAARVIVNRVWGWHFGKGAGRTAQRLRHAGRQADASGAARRSRGALHRARMVAQVAEQRNHDVRHLSAGEPAARRRPPGRRSERAAVAPESAAARRGGVSATRCCGRPGLLDEQMGGVPGDLDEDDYYRRAIYGRVSRARRADAGVVRLSRSHPDGARTATSRRRRCSRFT